MLSLSQYFRKGSIVSAIKLSNPAPSKFSFLLSRFWLRKRYKFAVISMVFLPIFLFLFHFSFSQIKVHETFLKSFENLKAGVLGRLASIILTIPVIFTAHGWAFTEGVSSLKQFFYAKLPT